MRHNATYYNAPGSYEPTISGFSQMPEDRDRESKAILTKNSRKYNNLKAIEEIDPVALEPWGRLLRAQDSDTKRFIWQRRTPEGLWPEVLYRINQSSRDIVFEIQFSRYEYCVAHVPMDSWEQRTCDAEAVRAAIQQDYLNRLRRIPDRTSIVKPGMKSLPLFKPIPVPSFAREQATYDVFRSSTSSKTATLVQTHALYDERRRDRPQQSRSHVSPSSSRVPRYPEVYDYHHYYEGYDYRCYYDTSERSSQSSDSSRTLVDSDFRYESRMITLTRRA